MGKRLASIVCSPTQLERYTFTSGGALIGQASRELADYFKPNALVRVTSPGGCDFTARIGKPFHEHGEYGRAGEGGDFPSGEVGFGPVEMSVSGQIVYDVKVQHLGILESPLTLSVVDDRVTEVHGQYRQAFVDLVKRRSSILNLISEVSLGLNPFVGVTAEPEFIPEEKTYGTAHCGHGGNASYGNRVGPHIDGVIKSPTVDIDGLTLMKDGRVVDGLLDGELLSWLDNPIVHD